LGVATFPLPRSGVAGGSSLTLLDPIAVLGGDRFDGTRGDGKLGSDADSCVVF